MTRLLRIIAFALIPALLCSCGDGALIQTESMPEITQQIYVVPERYNDEPYTFGYQPHPIYLEAERTVKFCATYIVDDHYLPTIIYDDYITEKIWDIDGNYFNLNSVRYSFSEPGHKVVTLKSIDKMNDTISEVLDVYVNTPISATLESPKDGFNMADPVSEDGVELSWKVSGTDEWETSYCTIFASYNKTRSPAAVATNPQPFSVRSPKTFPKIPPSQSTGASSPPTTRRILSAKATPPTSSISPPSIRAPIPQTSSFLSATTASGESIPPACALRS